MDASNSEKQDFETEKPPTPARRKSQSVDSNNGVSLHNIIHSKERSDNDAPMMPQTPYTASAVDDCAVPAASPPIRKTSFATLPNNTTTWQQQSVNYQASDSHSEFLMFIAKYIFWIWQAIEMIFHLLFSSRRRSPECRCQQIIYGAYEIGRKTASNWTRKTKNGSCTQSSTAKSWQSGFSSSHQQGTGLSLQNQNKNHPWELIECESFLARMVLVHISEDFLRRENFRFFPFS